MKKRNEGMDACRRASWRRRELSVKCSGQSSVGRHPRCRDYPDHGSHLFHVLAGMRKKLNVNPVIAAGLLGPFAAELVSSAFASGPGFCRVVDFQEGAAAECYPVPVKDVAHQGSR